MLHAFAVNTVVEYLDGDPEVVPALSCGLILAIAAVAFGVIGVWLLVPEGYMVAVAAVCFLLLARPTMLGAALDLIDYLSASGYANFGALIILWIGNTILLAGAVFSVSAPSGPRPSGEVSSTTRV
ncbi:hypothetical protein DFO66_12213 [Brevibacterium sanguinis]|uniref:Uncharacterized protein n=2 Tax=Brevibacterium TaxID=1696 RepID=A0A366IDZ0_9MICO|nr:MULTISPECIES: hypothetical protein [Brevibacterium]RBP61404.1 hypothetical protein DFO66_12213 [Brevibacterium sanguinis]RBP68487.1 hypothetical protein DFO65_11913 [Brevibacterium celere]